MGVGPRAGYVEIAPNVWRRRYERLNRNIPLEKKYYYMNDAGIRQNVSSEMKVITEEMATSAMKSRRDARLEKVKEQISQQSINNVEGSNVTKQQSQLQTLGYVLFPNKRVVKVVAIHLNNITISYRANNMQETRTSKNFVVYPTREAALQVPFQKGNYIVKTGEVYKIEGVDSNFYIWENNKKKKVSPCYYKVYATMEEAYHVKSEG